MGIACSVLYGFLSTVTIHSLTKLRRSFVAVTIFCVILVIYFFHALMADVMHMLYVQFVVM